MIELHNVSIEPQTHALSFTVDDGQLACLSGPKGTGKTQILRAILGLTPVSAGHISVDGELLTPQSAPYFRRRMAYVPQVLTPMYDYDSVEQVASMLFSLRVYRAAVPVHLAEDRRRWSAVPEAERYLLLLRCAVVLRQPILLVDEPTAPLDGAAAAEVNGLLQQTVGSGTTVLAVGHQVEAVQRIQL